MGGGAGSGSGAAPYHDQAVTRLFSSSLQGSSKQTNQPREQPLPPQGFKNIGNTCYANAALQCLLSTALSHALLDPNTAVIFKRYSSNSNILAMGSGSVDSDEEAEVSREEDKLLNLSASNFVDPLSVASLDIDRVRINDNAFTTQVVQVTLSNFSLETDETKIEKRQLREERRRARERQFSRETCSWLTSQLTDITRRYTAGPTQPSAFGQNGSGILPWSLFNISLKQQPSAGVVDPGTITRNVNKLSPCLQPYRQEDAHEFLRALLSTLIMDGQNRQLSSLFDGLLESAVTCRHASITRDRYMDLSLDVSNEEISDLMGALRHFTKTELLDSMNKVECGKCKTKRVVSKGLRLATAPTILVCHIKRFAYDCNGRTKRLSKSVKYPLRLEIGDFMSRANRGKPPAYELVGVLVHSGTSCDCGHYLAYIKSGNDWYKANDDIITKVDVETVLDQSAYILVYEVEGMRAEHGFHDFERYHKKPLARETSINTLSHSDHGIPRTLSLESWDPLTDDKSIDEILENSSSATVKTSRSHSPTAKRKQESLRPRRRQQKPTAAASLFDFFGSCGSDCAVEAVKDAIWQDLCNDGSTKDATPIPENEDHTQQGKPESVLRSNNEDITNGTSLTTSKCLYKPAYAPTNRHEPSNVGFSPFTCGEHMGSFSKKYSSSHVRPHSDAGVSNISILSCHLPKKENRDDHLSTYAFPLSEGVGSDKLKLKGKGAARGHRKGPSSGIKENNFLNEIDQDCSTIADTGEEDNNNSSQRTHSGKSGQQRRSKSLSRLSKSFKKLPQGRDGKICQNVSSSRDHHAPANLRRKDGSLPPLPQRGKTVSTSPIRGE